jgi:hypothetical protein
MNMPTTDAPADATSAALDILDRVLDESGPAEALDRLVAWFEERGDARGLLDALLLRARHELGLPLIQVGPLAEIPEPVRSAYEDRYVEAIRRVGRKLLDGGDLVAAWPYFRVLGERDDIARAIEAYQPSGEPGDETLGGVVDIAFNQGVHPLRGFELILDHYGACSAITAFEHLPPDEAVRVSCAGRLVGNLHEHLVANIRGDIARRGQPLPPEGTSIVGLLDGRDWLFADDGYHIDLSHLSAVVRMAPMLTDPATIALAVGLAEYGRRLSDRHRYAGDPPFEDTYGDHAVYLRALLGDDTDAAVEHFRSKLTPVEANDDPADEVYRDTAPAQVLVRLLLRLGRGEEAIDVAAEQFVGLPNGMLGCPNVAQLCQMAGRPDRLARLARERGDLVHYAAARLQAREL